MRLDKYFDTLVRRRWIVLGTLVVALLLTIPLVRILGTVYVGTSSVMLVSQNPTQALVTVEDLPSLATSPDVLVAVRSKFHLPLSLAEFRNKITAKTAPKSNVLPIIFRDRDRKLARDVPNAIADQTVVFFHQLATKQYDELTNYLQQESDTQRKTMEALDKRLQTVSGSQPFIGAADATDKLSQRVADLQATRATAYATLVADSASARAAAAQPAQLQRVVQNETLVNDPYVQALRASVSKDSASLAVQKAQYTSQYPGLPSLSEQVKHEQQTLGTVENEALKRGPSSAIFAQTVLDQRRADATVAGDRARLAALDAQVAEARGSFAALPTSGTEADNLRNHIEGARAAYQALEVRLAAARADKAATSSLQSLVVIDRAAQALPRIPAILLDILLAAFVLTVSIAGAFLYDSLDQGLRSPSEIERLYGRPVVGTIGSR